MIKRLAMQHPGAQWLILCAGGHSRAMVFASGSILGQGKKRDVHFVPVNAQMVQSCIIALLLIECKLLILFVIFKVFTGLISAVLC